MSYDFTGYVPSLTGPATDAVAVVPSDTVALVTVPTRLYVGGAGNLSVEMQGGGTVVFMGVPVGSMLSVRVTRVNLTGTTATNIVALSQS